MSSNNFPFSAKTYQDRRNELMKTVKTGRILLLSNNFSSINFKENHYRYRQDSSFLYYIGINQPEVHAVLDCETGETTLYGDEVSMDMIIWTGNQPALADLATKSAIENILPLSKLAELSAENIKYLPPYRAEHELFLKSALGVTQIEEHLDLILGVIAQRNIKSNDEIKLLDQAVTLSAKMHQTVIENTNPGMAEYQLVSIANAFAWDNNCCLSFPPILTINGQTLHNHYYGNTLKEDSMVLFDGGIELESGYCGDMTRTFPAGKALTGIQSDIYNTVHRSYLKAEEESKPGIYYRDVHLEAAKVMVEGLKAIGFMKGNTEDAVNAGAHSLFFQHGLGHMMGIDVHDMENLGEIYVGYDESISKSKEFGLKSLRLGRQLQGGNVITIEPGIYIIPELIDKFQAENKHLDYVDYNFLNKHRNTGGIRIEDDYLITSDSNRRLGEPLVNDLESILALKS